VLARAEGLSEPRRKGICTRRKWTATEVQIRLKRLNTELRLEVRKDSREVGVKIVAPETRTVIRQIPSEEILSIRERMSELAGVLFKTKT
jgi:uncharacterized FlaG/YvyC family protein